MGKHLTKQNLREIHKFANENTLSAMYVRFNEFRMNGEGYEASANYLKFKDVDESLWNHSTYYMRDAPLLTLDFDEEGVCVLECLRYKHEVDPSEYKTNPEYTKYAHLGDEEKFDRYNGQGELLDDFKVTLHFDGRKVNLVKMEIKVLLLDGWKTITKHFKNENDI